jgi:HTH-type transcriptional regulator/antitoxin HigA
MYSILEGINTEHKVTENQYEFVLARMEELLPMVNENTQIYNKNVVELSVMSDIVIAYEKEHFSIEY